MSDNRSNDNFGDNFGEWNDGEDDDYEWEDWDEEDLDEEIEELLTEELTPAVKTIWHANIDSEGNGNLVVMENGESWVTSSSDPLFPQYLAAAERGESLAQILAINIPVLITTLSDRISLRNGNLFFDENKVTGPLADTIRRFHEEGRDLWAVVRFMERLYAGTTSERSRTELFKWCEEKGLEISKDGYIIGYKAVKPDLHSINEGHAFVDGVEYNGPIPNYVGAVISMPRIEVNQDHNVGCSTGLHVGNMRYVLGFAGPSSPYLTVTVDPGDVMSVPTHDWGKMRTCRYTVVDFYNPEVSLEPEQSGVRVGAEDRAEAQLSAKVPTRFLDKLFGRKKASV